MNEKEQARVKTGDKISFGDLFQITGMGSYLEVAEFIGYGIDYDRLQFKLLRKVKSKPYIAFISIKEWVAGQIELYKLDPIPLHEQIINMGTDKAMNFLSSLVRKQICPIHTIHKNGLKEEVFKSIYEATIVNTIEKDMHTSEILISLVNEDKTQHRIVGFPRRIRAEFFYLYGSCWTLPEPENNDGRSTCFWCNKPTKQVPGISNFYNVCPKCGK